MSKIDGADAALGISEQLFQTVREGAFCRVMALMCFAVMCAMGYFMYRVMTEQAIALVSINTRMESVTAEQRSFNDKMEEQTKLQMQAIEIQKRIADSIDRMAKNGQSTLSLR